MCATRIRHSFYIAATRLPFFGARRASPLAVADLQSRYTCARVIRKPLLILSAFCTLAAVSSFGTEITTRDGTTYHNAKITAVDVDGIHVMHSNGVARLRFEDLPDALQKQYHYDAAKAAATQAAAAQQQREQEVAKAQEGARRTAETRAGRRLGVPRDARHRKTRSRPTH